MKQYAEKFYKSAAWRKTSRLYMTMQNYVCERCGGVGEICHHKKYITPWNIGDPNITLNLDNLECLCQDCHNAEHRARMSKAIFDDAGQMVGIKENKELEEYRKNIESYERATERRRTALK